MENFGESHQALGLKVQLNREKFHMDFFAQAYRSFYICEESPTWSVDFKTHLDGHTDCHRHSQGNLIEFLKINKNPEGTQNDDLWH